MTNRRSFLIKTAIAGGSIHALSSIALAAKTSWPKGYTLEVNFSIAAASGFRYRRPYVSAWIEDAGGKPVKQLALWVDASNRGYRYINHLRQWAQDNQSNSENLISTTSSATRDPGSYTLNWDGTDATGQAVAQGKYFVCLEVSREHGPYSSQRESVTIKNKAFSKTAQPSGDVASFDIQFKAS